MCNQNNKQPDKVYRGTFNVRITPELHRTAAIYASKEGKTLNSFVEEAIENYISK